jgi:hypothetical protein
VVIWFYRALYSRRKSDRHFYNHRLAFKAREPALPLVTARFEFTISSKRIGIDGSCLQHFWLDVKAQLQFKAQTLGRG